MYGFIEKQLILKTGVLVVQYHCPCDLESLTPEQNVCLKMRGIGVLLEGCFAHGH